MWLAAPDHMTALSLREDVRGGGEEQGQQGGEEEARYLVTCSS